MAWRSMKKSYTVRATTKLAREFAEMNSAPHDRPLSDWKMSLYEKFWEQQRFRTVTWAKAWCEETKDWYRIDGKHTSLLLTKQKEIPEFYVTIQVYVCDTLKDVADLYSTFDTNLQTRTARDIYLC